MKIGKLMVPIIVLCILLLPVAPVAAQGPEEPLVQKVEEKGDRAIEDRVGFAEQQATEEQLAADGNWTIAYSCYAAYVVADEAGLPPPDVEQCRGFEEALGIAPEEPPEREPVADAQELQDQARVEAEALAEDLEATAGRIAEEPGSAPEEAIQFVERALRAAERIIDTIGFVFVAPIIGVGSIAHGTASAALTGISAIGSAAVTVGEGTVSIASTIANGTREGMEGLGSAVDAVQDAVRALFAFSSPAERASPEALPDAGRLGDDGSNITDTIGSLVDDTTRSVA